MSNDFLVFKNLRLTSHLDLSCLNNFEILWFKSLDFCMLQMIQSEFKKLYNNH